MSITPLPDPPLRTMLPDDFIAAADAFLGALPQFAEQANATALSIQSQLNGTSITSLTIGAGVQTFTTQAGLGFIPGQTAVLSSAASPINQMLGVVTAYDIVAGTMSINVSATVGSGIFASWIVALALVSGAPPIMLAYRNRLINGSAIIDQRFATSALALNAGFQYGLDRWKATRSNSFGTLQQSVGGGAGATPNVIAYVVTTGAAPAAGDVNAFEQDIEGLMVPDLLWGTANAQPITISGLIQSSAAGTIAMAIQNSAKDRSYVFTVAVPMAGVITPFAITVPGDTGGTWLTTNGVGLRFIVDMGSGTNLNAGAAGAWQAGNFTRVATALIPAATTGVQVDLTAAQIEIGSTATAFEQRPFSVELALCQRYFEKSYDVETVVGTATQNGAAGGVSVSTAIGSMVCPVTFKVTKRTAPTVTLISGATPTTGKWSTPSAVVAVALLTTAGEAQFAVHNSAVTAAAATALYGHYTADAEL